MASLYIDRNDMGLRLEGKYLRLNGLNRESETIPLSMIDRIHIRGRVSLDTSTLAGLAEEGISVSIISGRLGKHQAVVTGRLHNDADRRLAQYHASLDSLLKDSFAQTTVSAKLAHQIRLVRKLQNQYPAARKKLFDANVRLLEIQAKLDAERHSVSVIRGLEGAAAAFYFEAYKSLFAPSLNFTARKKHPAPDPVNAVLSLSYTILFNEAVQAAWLAGLDPNVGFLHETQYGRSSLAADIIEPLRPEVDLVVLKLFTEKTLLLDDFTNSNGSCLLGKPGRQRFYAAWEQHASLFRRWMRLELYRFVHILTA